MYREQIVNPVTNRLVFTDTPKGKELLKHIRTAKKTPTKSMTGGADFELILKDVKAANPRMSESEIQRAAKELYDRITAVERRDRPFEQGPYQSHRSSARPIKFVNY